MSARALATTTISSYYYCYYDHNSIVRQHLEQMRIVLVIHMCGWYIELLIFLYLRMIYATVPTRLAGRGGIIVR